MNELILHDAEGVVYSTNNLSPTCNYTKITVQLPDQGEFTIVLFHQPDAIPITKVAPEVADAKQS